jgi:Putative adhesin
MRLLPASCLLAAAFATPGCAISIDQDAYVERGEQRFDVEGTVDLSLSTFDGPIEVRTWDRPEVLVTVEKRGENKDVVSKIEVVTERKDRRILIDARHSGSHHAFIGLGTFVGPSARMSAMVPRKTNLLLRTSDGSVVVERVDGRIEARTEDGSIRVIETSGELVAETGDGSIRLEDIHGKIDARTRDGSMRISGAPAVLNVRSGDGSIVLRVRQGAVMTGRWSVTTGDGSISAELPDGFDADIEADPGHDGRARNGLVLANVTGGTRDEPTLRGRLGKGGHPLVLRTGDGTIRLIK